ncbi:MAG: hypothetical protein IKZ38_00075 [Clostridia bacterium]|nr:hypothetical protein [Clostridia bacterium]
MRKKILAITFVLLMFGYLINAYNQPIFKGYAQRFTVYLGDNSSNARQRTVERLGYALSLNKFGESCSVKKEDFDIDEFINTFSAQPVFSESLPEGENYYFYSPSVKYLKTLGDKRVNLQVFIGEDRVVLGSPIIFGGY